jgi:hypothetical protein
VRKQCEFRKLKKGKIIKIIKEAARARWRKRCGVIL